MSTNALDGFNVHPDVDVSTAEQVAFERLDGTPVTVGQVAEAQARLLDVLHRKAADMTRSGNPARSAAGAELLVIMGRG